MSADDVRQRDVAQQKHHGLPHLSPTNCLIVHPDHHNERDDHFDQAHNAVVDGTDHRNRNFHRGFNHELQTNHNECRIFHVDASNDHHTNHGANVSDYTHHVFKYGDIFDEDVS